MLQRRIPEWLRHAPAPSVRGFAVLAGIEAIARGILISVFPLAMYKVLQDASLVSEVYFVVGVASLIAGLMVPWLNRYVPRRWMYSIGAMLYAVGSLLAISNEPIMVVLALLLNTVAIVITFVCFNAYVLDYIAKIELGQCETQRMLFSALGWSLGPVCGVLLMKWWEPLPFLIASAASLVMMFAFLAMRLGNGKLITRARQPAPNPLAFLRRFFVQPRLIAGWLFAVLRSCAWWVYIVYLPIFAVENGLSEETGGIMLSISNGALFLTPFMLRWMQRCSVKYAVRTGFLIGGALFVIAGLAPLPPLMIVFILLMGSFLLILLDVCGGLPFLMAVKPSERTEMSAVYSSYRDVSGILTPGAVWLVLLAAPVSGAFVAAGAGLFGAWMIAGKLHPRLGQARITYPADPLESDLKGAFQTAPPGIP